VWPAVGLTLVATVCCYFFLYAWFAAIPAAVLAVMFGVVGLGSVTNWRRGLSGFSIAISALIVFIAGGVLVFYLAGLATST
jgi:hypothetical protein